MKTRPSPDPKLRVRQLESGQWIWCYSDAVSDVELLSNETYPSREEAEEWARRAYPDLPFAEEEDQPERT